ncbi:MAG: tetratricopeptide repeat protein [Kofleriaceae bacterium]
MDSRRFDNLFTRADAARLRGDNRTALDLLREALAIDPDHARAHALLALVLVDARRPHGARIEAGLALAADPDEPFAHLAMATVAFAERRLADAWLHLTPVLTDDTVAVDATLLAAELRDLEGDTAAASELLDRARALAPDAARVLARCAIHARYRGDHAAARRHADDALAAGPDNSQAHLAAGWVALDAGAVDAAEAHVRSALASDADDHDGLTLLSAIKARRSLWLGLWWRWNTWLTARSDAGRVGMLLGWYLGAQLLMIGGAALGWTTVESVLGWVWIAFCAYTWIAPGRFRRMVDRELARVELSPEY